MSIQPKSRSGEPFNLIWSQNAKMVRGWQNGAYLDGSLVFPVTFPGRTSDVQKIVLRSSAQANGTFDVLKNVAFYLDGNADDLAEVQGNWPNLNTSRPEVNGGLQISFDGVNWPTGSASASGLCATFAQAKAGIASSVSRETRTFPPAGFLFLRRRLDRKTTSLPALTRFATFAIHARQHDSVFSKQLLLSHLEISRP